MDLFLDLSIIEYSYFRNWIPLFNSKQMSQVNKVEMLPLTSNGEEFLRGKYNGIHILKRKKDGFINATVMCNQFKKRFRKIFENVSWKEFFDEFCWEYLQNTTRPKSGAFMYELEKII